MTTQQIENRNNKAHSLRVIRTAEGSFYVESSEGKICYKVHVKNGDRSCTCGDYSISCKKDPQFSCKHILAVMNANGNTLPGEILERTRPKLDERFITTIQGKDFVVYAGLLDLAHQRGLSRIEVEVIQYPTKGNGSEAICKAFVESRTGDSFIEWGDANPKNTNAMISKHILRMAATRAKARALRDMTNIGMTCLEELGDIDEVIPAAENQKKATASKDTKVTKQTTKTEPTPKPPEDPEPVQDGSPKPSTAQMKAVENLARRRNIEKEGLEELAQQQFGTSLSNLTATEASQFIRHLQQSA